MKIFSTPPNSQERNGNNYLLSFGLLSVRHKYWGRLEKVWSWNEDFLGAQLPNGEKKIKMISLFLLLTGVTIHKPDFFKKFLQNSAANWPRMRATHRPQNEGAHLTIQHLILAGKKQYEEEKAEVPSYRGRKRGRGVEGVGHPRGYVTWVAQRNLKPCWSESKSFVVSLYVTPDLFKSQIKNYPLINPAR